MTAAEIIARLRLARHPEGGWFGETFRDDQMAEGRAISTAIYYLLEAGERSHWHKVDAVEIWHYYSGAPLSLGKSDGGTAEFLTLGPDLMAGQSPQIIIPRSHWQCAESLGEWTLVGCTVAPGFEFSGFKMAPTDWSPSVL